MPVFTPTVEQEAELGIVEAPGGRGSKTPERRATNVKLWQKLQAEHARAWIKEHPPGQRTGGAKGGKGRAGEKTAEVKTPLTPEEERRRAKERARRLAAALWEFKVDWLRMLIAGRLRGEGVSPAALVRILCYFALDRGSSTARHDGRDALRRAIRAATGEKLPGDEYRALCELNDARSLASAAELLAGWFWSDREGPSAAMWGEAVVETAGMLEISLAREWAAGRAGPLSRRYFELHDKAALARLAAAWKVPLAGDEGKAAIVEALMGQKKPPLPEEIERARRPK